MHTYSLGVASSWLVIIVLLLAAIGFAVWSYLRTVPPVSPSRRVTLTLLRSLAISLLLFALFEPVLTLVSASADPPEIAVLLDNSQSMTIAAAGRDRREEYASARRNALTELTSPATYFRFDAEASVIASPDSLDFSGGATDIARPLATVRELADERNVRATVLISDGAFNSGTNPLYAAEEAGRPVFVVGVGDSTEPKDVSVQALITNEFGTLDAELPINVSLKSSGFDQTEAKVVLSDNGAPVAEQTVVLRAGQQSYPLIFAYKPTAEGVRKLTATVKPAAGELTGKNNAVSEYVRISKQKKSVAVFAGAPSPDVSFLNAALTAEKSANVQLFIQKHAGEFYTPLPTAQQLAETELIVFAGFPIASTPNGILSDLKRELERGKPLMFIASQQTDYTKLRQFDAFMPFSVVSSRQQEYLTFADVKQQALGNVVMKLEGVEGDADVWNQLPPVFRTETFVRMKPEAELLASVKVNGVSLAEPLICAREFQQSKTIAVLGYGLYRWKLAGFAAEQSKGRATTDVFSSFLGNSLRWLQADDRQKQVRIKTTKKFYGTSESVGFIAQVYDRSLAPVENADVRIAVIGGKLQQRDLVLQALGNGRYSGQIDGLLHGDYAFSGTASAGNKPLGTDNGRFSVSDGGVEFQNLRMNVELLRSLAERTGGKFYTAETANNLPEDIHRHQYFTPQTITRRSEFALWNLPWLLGASLLFFALEWFLRKRGGMV